MKDYKEMTKCVLEARDAYEAKKGKRQQKTSDISESPNGKVYSIKKNDNKKVVLSFAPIFGGVLIAVLIGIIVSDYSVDRTEDKTTETITETTEGETTEEFRQEAMTVDVKEKQEELNSNDQNEFMPDYKNNKKPEKEEKFGIGTKSESPKEQDGPGLKEDESTVGPGGSNQADQEEDKPPVEPVENEPTFESDDPSQDEPIDEELEAEGPNDLTYGGKYFQWKEVLQGEGDIIYVLCADSPKFSGAGSNRYEKHYKGMTIAEYVWINRDGSINSEKHEGNSITLEMLQSTDFSNAKKNLSELEAKMIKEGYNRCVSSPNFGMEPIIKKNTNGSSLVYVVRYQSDNDPGFNETYGFSDTFKTRRSVEYDLISGKILYEYLSSIDENGEIVGKPVEIYY